MTHLSDPSLPDPPEVPHPMSHPSPSLVLPRKGHSEGFGGTNFQVVRCEG